MTELIEALIKFRPKLSLAWPISSYAVRQAQALDDESAHGSLVE